MTIIRSADGGNSELDARFEHAPDVFVAPCTIGQGLFAGRAFAAGEVILWLSGERYGRDDPLHDTDAGANLLQIGPSRYILLTAPAVYANHSCDPNAGVADGRRLVAIASIGAGQEIRYDYSTTMDEDFWTLDCRCGAPTCRGRVTDFHWLPEAVKARYRDLGVVPRWLRESERRRAGQPAVRKVDRPPSTPMI